MLKFRTRFPRIWKIHSNTPLGVESTNLLGLKFIPYYFSINYFRKSWQMSSDPCSYAIYIGLGYLVNYVVSTKSVIYIALLSSYCVILNHPVIGYIIVTDFRFNFSLCHFLLVTWGAIISKQMLFHGIYSDSLAGNLSYFIFERFVRWQVSKLFTSSRT